MLVVTLMNYDDPLGVLMCKMWLYCLRRIHPEAEVIILHHDKFSAIRPFVDRFDRVCCVETDLTGIPKADEWTATSPEGRFPSMDLTISVWRMYERLGLDRFLFIEPDAFVLGDISGLWEVSEDKPFIGIAERKKWGQFEPYLNLGVYAYSGRKFLTYDKLFRFWERSGRHVPPVGDQGLVNAYFRSIDYSPFHPDIGIEYNCLAANCQVICADDKEIEVRSGPRPKQEELGSRFPEYIGWDKNVKVKILHAFWWKLWTLPTAKNLWEYLKRKVEEMDRPS